MRLVTSLGAFLLATSVATAGPALPADKHEPPVWADPTANWIQITTAGDESYTVTADFQIYGATSTSDRFRLDLKQGKKVVGTAACNASFKESENLLYGECKSDKPLKSSGAHTYELIYTDDQTDKDYLVQTYKVDVRRWKGIGKSIEWGYTPDDLLALAYFRHVESTYGQEKLVPTIELWAAGSPSQALVLRCTVDGKKIPDFEAGSDGVVRVASKTITSSWSTEKTQKEYTYARLGVYPKNTRYGKRPPGPADNLRYFAETPGKWDCVLRDGGKPVRQFMFTVNDAGMVEPGELQTGSKNVKLTSDVVLIDMRIPKDNPLDKRIRQDALKKGVGWGLPWPDSPKSKDAQAAFPPTMGTPD